MKTDATNIFNLLNRIHRIDVAKYDASFLNKSLQKRIAETHCKTAGEYFTFLEKNNNEGEIFLDSLHISYSEFFRNPLTYSVLERIVLPTLMQQKKNTKRNEIRIWSAACAGGQEAYSLAMLLEELKNSNNEKLSYRIFATDQCEAHVEEAQKGIYNTAALNNLNMKRAKQWFTKHADTYTIKQELKENLDLSVFDLLSKQLGCPPASIFGDFDMVVCANLLFYYKPEYRKIILDKATNCLANGGYIVVGETESDILIKYNFHEVFPQSGIFKSKK
jgi:chemotaxis protein methyltransferase CheR